MTTKFMTEDDITKWNRICERVNLGKVCSANDLGWLLDYAENLEKLATDFEAQLMAARDSRSQMLREVVRLENELNLAKRRLVAMRQGKEGGK